MRRSAGLMIPVMAAVMAVAAWVPAARSEPAAQLRPPSPITPTNKHPTIDSQLIAVARAFREGGEAAALAEARRRSLKVVGSRVLMMVESRGPDRAGARAAVAAAGGTVEEEVGNLVQALVPPSGIERLGNDAAVRFLRPPLRLIPMAPCTPNHPCPLPDPVTGDGVKATNADAWHKAGLTGAGQKIAIIDVGFKGYKDSQASGDLPYPVLINGGTCTDFEADPHGTAVAEIVHEMAPDAELLLICVQYGYQLSVAQAVALGFGYTIINASVGSFNTSRGDGSSTDLQAPENAVKQATDSGVLWVNAAGNHARRHWSGQFSSSTEYHHFAPGDVGNSVNVPDGQQLCAALKWDDWPSSDQDYDLYVFLPGDSFAYLSSENAQTGSQPPRELVCVETNTSGATQPYNILIRKAGATKTPRFDLFVTVGELEYSAASGSLWEPASSPAAFAVGSICPKDDALMLYSSQGPNIADVIKPDIAAPGHVSSGAGTFGKLKTCSASTWDGGFAGTSAAAPHVAGAAALLKQAHPNLTVADLKGMLESKVKDLGPPGKDNQYGAGKLWLGTPPTTFQFDPDWLKIKIKQAKDSRAAEFEAAAKKCDRCTVRWLFGDGESATGTPVRHTYREPGWYRVSAHFTDPRGLVRAASKRIRVR